MRSKGVFAERDYWRFDGATRKKVRVRIYQPDASPAGSWASRLQLTGLERGDLDHDVHGEDSLQALELAIRLAEDVLRSSPELTSGKLFSDVGRPGDGAFMPMGEWVKP